MPHESVSCFATLGAPPEDHKKRDDDKERSLERRLEAAQDGSGPSSTHTTPAAPSSSPGRTRRSLLHDLGRWDGNGRTTGDKVKTSNGDVLVDAVQHGARTYDATVNPVSACEDLHVLEATAGTEASDASVDGIQAIACPSHSTTCYGASALRSPSEGAVVAIDVSSAPSPPSPRRSRWSRPAR